MLAQIPSGAFSEMYTYRIHIDSYICIHMYVYVYIYIFRRVFDILHIFKYIFAFLFISCTLKSELQQMWRNPFSDYMVHTLRYRYDILFSLPEGNTIYAPALPQDARS